MEFKGLKMTNSFLFKSTQQLGVTETDLRVELDLSQVELRLCDEVAREGVLGEQFDYETEVARGGV